MLFTKNRAHDCPFKKSFNKMMKKYRLSDVPKRLSGGYSDEFSESSTDSSSAAMYDDLKASERSSERSSEQLAAPCEASCMHDLRNYCIQQGIESMSEERLFRFANFHRFDVSKAKDAIDENRDNAFMDIEMKTEMKGQFVTKLLFPLTGLRTKKHHSQVIYSRPSRCNHGDDDMTKVLESLCYVMNDFSQTEQQCREGVALVTNLEGFEREHFDPQDWHQFLMALQGALVPTKVTLGLLVNPPSWFEKDVWKKMRSSMPAQFRKNIHLVRSDKLGDYLMEDYQAYLPTELNNGYRPADEIIEDYIDLKAFQDKQKRKQQLIV